MPLGEFAIIDRYFRDAGVVRGDVVLGVGDDGALLRPPAGFDLVAVSDTLVEGVHFPVGSPARSVGHRALAVNLSDIAAMGGTPAWSLLALTLPAVDEAWLSGFADGFAALARSHDVALVGGDTTRGPLMIGVQVLGFVPQGQGLRRSGGRPGDVLCVSGTPGDAAAGLALLQGDAFASSREYSGMIPLASDLEFLRSRFEFPMPRVSLGMALRDIASASIDVSDGLAGDIGKLAAASGCRAVLDLDRLPRSVALSALVADGRFTEAEALRFSLAGGDDYELAFAVPPSRLRSLETWLRRGEITLIGELAAGESAAKENALAPISGGPRVALRRAGRECSVEEAAAVAAGFDHFG